MHLGIDLGTTRTIVAAVDRGNYPVVTFLDTDDEMQDHLPSVVAVRDGRLIHGWEAQRAGEEGLPVLRSFKRALADADVNTGSTIRVGDAEFNVLEVVTSFCLGLRQALTHRSSISERIGAGESIDAVIAVPAHAYGAQRFLTLEAFRSAGFEITGMVNEPSAAGFEYSHRQGRTITSKRTRVVVYDLGGGTFDTTLVKVDGTAHEVLGTVGLNDVGGDDFDVILADCALTAAGRSRDSLSTDEWQALVQLSRAAKEHLYPQSKRLVLEVAGDEVTVLLDDFYEAAIPLVQRTVDAMSPVVGALDSGGPDLTEVAGIYLVGGASGLPLVPRMLRETFGRRVHRSPYPAASTAIGLAIVADTEAGYSLTDRLSRAFGVFREGDGGSTLNFDPILRPDQTVSSTESVTVTRRYWAAHNVGYFRFVEYTSVDDEGQPRGDIAPFADIRFPFAPELQDGRDLSGLTVVRRENWPEIEEKYVIDPHGMIEVIITDLHTGYQQRHSLATGG
ncbi:Hsp70 family protein [Kribbia dieselivorans]|uniref:Hsp70 family protein n=1 Tax=Kribbia dieselivorans TaxID=331526 RepID=UPI0008388C4E|nr:Hsp70 family protein [Kribbia dieselivorans]